MENLDFKFNDEGTYSLTVSGRTIGFVYTLEDATDLVEAINSKLIEELQTVNEGLHGEIEDLINDNITMRECINNLGKLIEDIKKKKEK